MSGKFVISLDFEGMWGSLCSRDKKDVERFRIRTKLIDEYVSRMLRLFEKYDIHVTWAVVGAMLCENSDEVKNYLPDDIYYEKYDCSLYKYLSQIDQDEKGQYYVRRIVESVLNAPNQEIGSHTFSHIYALEQGINEKLIRQDFLAFERIMEKFDMKPCSLVMPRNMVKSPFFSVIKEYKYLAVRDRQRPAIKIGNIERNKIIDFLDCYIPIRRDLCYSESEIEKIDGVYNIRASMFFRTYDYRFKYFENLKILRIKREMLRSARNNKVFHLWWHPHNMATNIEWNFTALEELLKYFNVLRTKYGYESHSMGEIVRSIMKKY